jgi:endonuclease III
VKNASAHVKKLNALLRKQLKAHKLPDEAAQPSEPVMQLVMGFLQWNANRKQAQTAYDRLLSRLVDHNDLRVTHTHEIVSMLGSNYPRAEERAARMHDALQEIFIREHVVALSQLHGKSKKDIRHYLSTLPGIPPYVVAQVLLLSFGGHAIPVDDHLAALFKEEGAAEPDATVEEIESFVEYHVKAGEGPAVHHALQVWADIHSLRSGPAPDKPSSRKRSTTARKTSKKK